MSKSYYAQVSHAKEILERLMKKNCPKTITASQESRVRSAYNELKKVQDELREEYA